MSGTQRTIRFLDEHDALLTGRVLRVELHRPDVLPKVYITRTGELTIDVAYTSDAPDDQRRDLLARPPRAVADHSREQFFRELSRRMPPSGAAAGARIAPMRVLTETLDGGGPVGAPGRLPPSLIAGPGVTDRAAPGPLTPSSPSTARADAHRRALARAKIAPRRARAPGVEGLADPAIEGPAADPPEVQPEGAAPGAEAARAAAAGGQSWWIEVFDEEDDGRPLQAELLAANPPGLVGVDGDRWFRVGGGLYWRFRPEGVRRALPDPFDAMVHRTADTGRTNGGLLGPRDPGWRAAFARATARLEPYARPLPQPNTRCTLSSDAMQLLLRLLGPDERSAEAGANWMRAVLAWADDLGEDDFAKAIFDEYLPQLRAATARAPADAAGWWAEARASWEPRGLFDTRPAILDPGSAALEERLINGMSPHGLAERGLGADRRLLWLRTWDEAYRSTDGADYVLPDVEVVLLPPQPGGLPRIESIGLRFPGEAWLSQARPPDEATEHDAMDAWSQAKRYVRQALLVSGQLDWHVARGHFFMELHCVALCRSLPTHAPLREKRWPFVRSVDEINEFGEELLFSGTGLLVRASGLSEEGVNGRLRAQLRGALTDGRPPRPPSCDGDRFSRWAQLAWVATGKYVEDNFTDDVFGEEITRRWAAALLEGLPEAAGSASAPTRADALTEGARWCEPEAPVAWPPTDVPGWRALVHRLMYHATFLHSYIGHQQFEDGGNPLLAPFGLYRPRRKAGAPPPSWARVAPRAAHAGLQVGMAELLALPRWGMLCEADEPGSHPAQYGALLALLEAELAAARAALPPGAPDPYAGFSTQDIRGRINI